MVVRAMRADGKDVRPAAHQQDVIVADTADELAAVGKLFLGDAVRQIGAAWMWLLLSLILNLSLNLSLNWILNRILGHGALPSIVRSACVLRHLGKENSPCRCCRKRLPLLIELIVKNEMHYPSEIRHGC